MNSSFTLPWFKIESMKKIIYKTIFLIIGFAAVQLSFSQTFQSDCNPDTIQIDTSGFEINWQQFPDFNLPFTVIYHGLTPSDSVAHPLRKGFSHITGRGKEYRDTIWPQQRSYTWTGIANADNWALNTNQPWRMIKSPWGNDIVGYRERWDHRLDVVLGHYKYQPPPGEAAIDMVIANLEMAYHYDAGILAIKQDPLIPPEFQNLSDEEFIAAYKRDMSLLYAEPLLLAKDSLHESTLISSYAEVPVRRTWHLIDDTSWHAWTTDSANVDYLMQDTSGWMNSNFYNFHDFICPSVYYFYNVDTIPVGKKYLAYNLFQQEVNAAWNDKNQLVYCWLNYHGSSSATFEIKPWMAEATAIFPFMSGAMGLYPWKPALPHGYDAYEYFIKGMYRLSQFSDFFDGSGGFVIPEPAHESFSNDLPIWRGIVKGNDILIAAHNPYAAVADTTLIPVNYGTWSDTIALIGTEVFLCKLNMWFVGSPETNRNVQINIYPNPTKSSITIASDNPIHAARIIDINGRITEIQLSSPTQPVIDISNFPPNIYLLELISNHQVIYKKIIKN